MYIYNLADGTKFSVGPPHNYGNEQPFLINNIALTETKFLWQDDAQIPVLVPNYNEPTDSSSIVDDVNLYQLQQA